MSKHQFVDIVIPIEKDNVAIQRDESLCTHCSGCRYVCDNKVVGHLYDLESTGDTAICVHCGQCANACPVNAITEVYEYGEVREAINDPDKIVIFSTSPAVRVALGEEFGLLAGSFVEGQMVAALKAVGGDYVLDTNFAADLTIMEEASELVDRIVNKSTPLPQFTSCCPGWVKFVETFYPELIGNLSSSKSPIGMQGATIKTFFAKERGIDPRKIVNVAVTPCTAKKYEIRRPEMNDSAKYHNMPELRDMDHVITTRELARWMKEENIDLKALSPADFDPLMGSASGAGVIFGNTGGVMEAAARTAYYFITNENPPTDLLEFKPVRGLDNVKETSVTIGGVHLNLAVVHGIRNAKTLVDTIKSGGASYDFVEVMACHGGCIGGGGQPKSEMPMTDQTRAKRIAALYANDEAKTIRLSHENPDIKYVYEHFYEKPLGKLSEEMLHTHYLAKNSDLGAKGMVDTWVDLKDELLTMDNSTKICHCNNVTLGDIKEIIDDFAESFEDVQAMTRVSTGCKGCTERAMSIVTELLKQKNSQTA